MEPTTMHGTRPVVRTYFHYWSRVYDSPVFQVPFFGRVHRRVLAATEGLRPADVLDVGCGTGELLRALARRFPEARLVGFDLSPEMLEKARQKQLGAREVRWETGNVVDMPFEDASFDLVTNTISSHYYLDLPRALAEMARVCRPGGTLVMASLGNGALGHLPGPFRDELRTVQAVYRSPALQRRELAQAGFTVERLERVRGFAWLYRCRRTP